MLSFGKRKTTGFGQIVLKTTGFAPKYRILSGSHFKKYRMKTTGFDQIVLKTTGFPVNPVKKLQDSDAMLHTGICTKPHSDVRVSVGKGIAGSAVPKGLQAPIHVV